MGTINGSGNIPLPPPVNQNQTGSSQVGQQGSFVSQSSSVLNIKDQFISGNAGTSSTLHPGTDKAQPNNPSIDRSYDSAPANIRNLKGANGTGNEWFTAQALVAVSVAMQDLAYVMAKNKLTQGMMAAETILQMTQTALEIAKNIRDEGQLKFIAGIVSGAMTAASGALSIAGSIHARGAGASEMDRITMGYRGAGSVLQGAGEFVKAFCDLASSNLEAEKQMLQNMTQIWNEKLKNLDDAVKSSDPDAVFQMLQKITDALYQSLGWR